MNTGSYVHVAMYLAICLTIMLVASTCSSKVTQFLEWPGIIVVCDKLA